MEFVYIKIFGLEIFLRYVPSVGPMHEYFVVPGRISIYLSSNHYIAILALSGGGSAPVRSETPWKPWILQILSDFCLYLMVIIHIGKDLKTLKLSISLKLPETPDCR